MTAAIEIPLDVPEHAHEFYRQMVRKGTAPRLAEMLACRKAPKALTDREFFAGRSDVMSRVNARAARSLGINPESHTYIPTMARWPGGTDPQAWVSGRGDIQRVHEENGWGCEGAVTVKAREHEVPDAPKEYKVAEHLVDQHVTKALAANPELAPTPGERKKFRQETAERLAGDHGKVSMGKNLIEAALGE